MNTRVLLFAGMLATAAIAFSGVFAETTGVELTESAVASCGPVSINDDPCPPHPSCYVAAIYEAVTKEEAYCLM